MTERVWYPESGDFGVDDRMVREIGEELVSADRPRITAENNGTRPNYDEWSRADVVAYLGWLTDITNLAGQEGPVRARQIDRASIIGLGGPSKATAVRLSGESSIIEMQRQIGEYRTRADYAYWTEFDYVHKGKYLANEIGRRPTRDDIAMWNQEGSFPSEAQILHRFDRLGKWHEHIGYPSVKGWEIEDYAQWCAALYMAQPDLRVTDKVLNYYSKQGRGPGAWTVNKVVGGIPDLREIGSDIASSYTETRELQKAHVLQSANLQMKHNPNMERVLEQNAQEEGEDDFIQSYTRYMILRKLAPSYNQSLDFAEASKASSKAELFGLVRGRRNEVSIRHLAVASDVAGVREVFWPSYRFSNVDFSIPDELVNPKIGAPSKRDRIADQRAA